MTLDVFDSIARIGRAEWDALFPGEIETWDYYRAVEQAGLPGFAWRYLALRQDGALVALAPAFLTDYRLDTTITGGLKRWTERLARLAPRLMRIRMLCLGSPVSEICHVGIAPDTAPQRRQALLAELLAGLQRRAVEEKAGLIAVKDAPDGSPIDLACRAAGLTRLPGMPTAVLPIDFPDMDGYLKRLSRVTRKDIKRKMRHGAALRVEARERIDDVLEPVMALYEATWQRSELRLEHLTPEYFTAVLRAMPGRALCFLYWQDDRLVAFNLVLLDGRRMIDKFFGTDAASRQLNLYHVSWMENVRQCLAYGLGAFQAGQAFYGEKVRMGSRLDLNWQFFTHRSRMLAFVLRQASRLVRLDRLDPEIRGLMARSPAGRAP
jgi:predicted N-acyltransferase